MDFYKLIRIGPLRIYITTRRMKKMDRQEPLRKKNRHKLKFIRSQLIRNNGRHCQDCGGMFPKKKLELHHVVPVCDRPDLITDMENLRILCHECHMKYHRRQRPP